jgi:hypothetical protein
VGLFASGVAVLAAGVLVYSLERPAGSVPFLPAALSLHGGQVWLPPALSGPLPTFLHTLAFTLITAAFLAPTRRAGLAACAAWAAVNIAFEASQHTAFRDFTGFGMQGRFDPLDLLAALLGAAAAYPFIRRPHSAEGAPT